MFTGIIEASVPIREFHFKDTSAQLVLERPPFFTDLTVGHSVAVNGICLTIEDITNEIMKFSLGLETMRILTQMNEPSAKKVTEILRSPVNLERPLKLGDRLHGHWVTGHVDGLMSVTEKSDYDQSCVVTFSFPQSFRPYFWPKGSVTINGVSLTINSVSNQSLSVCLIPETLKRTNLSLLEIGDRVTFEADYLAKASISAYADYGRTII